MTASDPADDREGKLLSIDYIKGSQFRTVRPDGAVGSLTPSGLLQLVFFAERQAIPQRVVHRLEEDGSLGDEVEIVGRKSVVRELEVAISLDAETAEGVVRFLTDLLKEAASSEEEENE